MPKISSGGSSMGLLRNKKAMKVAAIVIAAVFTLGTVLAYVSWERDDVVAVVNGQRIQKAQVVNEVLSRHGQSVLDEMVEMTLIRQRARAAGVSADRALVDREIEQIESQFGSRAEYLAVLQQYGYTEEGLRQRIEQDLLLDAIVIHDFAIEMTEEQAREFFEQYSFMFMPEESATVRHILVHEAELADDLLVQLGQGADFAELAVEHSQDPGSGAQGGLLGKVRRGDMVEEFEEAVFTLPVGAYSEPVETVYGYHIILVEDRVSGEMPAFEDVRDEVMARALRMYAREQSDLWLQQVRQSSDIEYRVRW